MAKINFQNLPNTNTPLNATNMNAIQNLNEEGSNENGYYIKFVDGTLICWNTKQMSSNVAITTAEGSLYKSNAFDPFPDYPSTFISAPEAFVERSGNDNAIWWIAKTYSGGLSSVRNIQLVSPNSRTLTKPTFYYIAIGRWKN